MADFTLILMAPMLIKNFNFSHILEYCDIINDAHGSNNDYRHTIIKGQHLFVDLSKEIDEKILDSLHDNLAVEFAHPTAAQ